MIERNETLPAASSRMRESIQNEAEQRGGGIGKGSRGNLSELSVVSLKISFIGVLSEYYIDLRSSTLEK